ncbi:hypothetical protein OEA41_002706 [Lepraria neglecta]|uniref:1,3-beta-glucanosyltransferase n=1 Tax=Lepraria neglecta TaxID=209136 RepID=A0AAD9Z3I3_9LECA|nr:hypothetical protein OEA41_002706 [Lepraria neglecta]
MFAQTLSFAVLAAASIASAADAPTISAVGSKFFFSNGTQYYIKGIAYQLTDQDPLIDKEQCTLDANMMADLGANTIRVYHVDPTADHDGCMTAFANAGIYLFLDLDTTDTQFNQSLPSWNQTQLSAFEAVLDTFQGYSNLAGVFVANEAMTMLNGSDTAPFIKAAIRDVKSYRQSKNYRDIPVGYSGADIPSLRPMLQNYLACGDDAADAADFFSLNVYEWCGESSFDGSGYSQLVANATGLQIPIFISETGCRIPKPRTFDDQDSILGTDMENTWSGAIVYEWIEESNDYGLISYGPKVDPMSNTAALDGYTRSGTPSPVTPDYSNLKSHWATLHPTGVALSAYSASAASLTPIACPSMTPNGWVVNPTASLPSLGETLDLATTSTGGLQSGKPTSTAKKGAAAVMKPASVMMGGNEVAGMGISLICVMLGFLFWL